MEDIDFNYEEYEFWGDNLKIKRCDEEVEDGDRLIE